MGWSDDYYYKPYVPVAQRRAQAAREVARRIKKGEAIRPIVIEGRIIASTFWGKAWCDHLESYSDYANRLPRGRTYVRNGSVVHLAIEPGRIKALVSGSSIYEVQIEISALVPSAWLALKKRCAGQISTIVELLQGKLSQAVMATVTDRDQGLFPQPKEIRMRCSCPDGVGMCKHLAAVLYGVGHRLDAAPDLLFQLRGVNHLDLIAQAIPTPSARPKGKSPQIAAADLGAIFGIELDDTPTPPPLPKAPARPTAQKAAAPPVAPATKVPLTAARPAPVAATTKQVPAPPARPTPSAATKKAPVVAAKQTPVAAPQFPARPALKALIAATRPAPVPPVQTTPVAPAKAVAPAKKAPVAAKPTPAAKGKKAPRASTK